MRTKLQFFSKAMLFCFFFYLMFFTGKIIAQTVIVNYDFNNASTYPVSPTTTATDISCSLTCTEAFATFTGTASGEQAFTSNSTAGYAIAMNNSSGTNTKYWSAAISGSDLENYKSYGVYFQTRRSSTGAQKVTLFYSTDGSNFTSLNFVSLTVADQFYEGVFDLSSITSIDFQNTVYFRLAASEASSTGTLRFDNLQIKAIKVETDTNTNASWLVNGNLNTTDSSFIGTVDNHDLVFKSNNVERFRLSSNGNVGVGTAFPAVNLHLKGITQGGANPLSTYFRIEDEVHYTPSGSRNVYWDFVVSGTQQRLVFLTGIDTTTKHIMVLNENGNVGIGVDAPTEKLHIQNGSIYIDGERGGLIVNEGGHKRVGFMKYSGREAGIWRVENQDFEIGRLNNVDTLPGLPGSTDFSTDFYINGDGKIGIGTTSPKADLSVKNGGSFRVGEWEFSDFVGSDSIFYLRRQSWNGSVDVTTNVFALKKNGAAADLYLTGKLYSTDVSVLASISWPDYVFNNDYKLKSLTEVEKFLKENKHLPDVPSAMDIQKNGQNLGEMNAILLKKIEELTLYSIEQNKRIKALEEEMKNNKNR